jgi:hypothetical protein
MFPGTIEATAATHQNSYIENVQVFNDRWLNRNYEDVGRLSTDHDLNSDGNATVENWHQKP